MEYTVIQQDSQLDAFVEDVRQSDLVGFDTEFVAEDCYQPDLCLLQFSTRERVYIVDPKTLTDLTDVWNLLTDENRTVIVHAGREETLFVFRATGRAVPKLFDVQVAVGLLGGEYPASYGKVLQRFLGEMVPKGETRTDWRKRPLSQAQLEYAALDVLHLPQLYEQLTNLLRERERLGWLNDELQRRQLTLLDTAQQEGWYRMSGVQSLRTNQLGIVQALWRWRDSRARKKDMPARRVLRDDLIIELAKRGTDDARKISQIRGLHHSGFQRFLPEIADCIRTGRNAPIPETPWASTPKRIRTPALLQQFLTAAMSYLCRQHEIAPAIVGTSDDVGKLVTYWLTGANLDPSEPEFPQLLRGWRAEFVGEPLHEIFSGKQALRVLDPRNEMPLGLCEVGEIDA